MAFRYLIFSTGTTFSSTIVRESATSNPGVNEKSYYTDFMIPEIQPLYLWRVNNVTTPTDVIPNIDANINAYLDSVAPAPTPDDLATLGDLTGETTTKIDKVVGVTGDVPIFTLDGNLESSGLSIPELTGLTTYTFVESGNTQISQVGNQVTIFTPTGDTTAVWGNITGTLSNQTDLWNTLTGMTGETATKLDITDFNTYTGETEQWLEDIDDDITYLSGQTDTKLAITSFNAYTGTTQPILDAALTGVTNLGTGTTIGGTSGRDITLKSISVLGGLSLSGDADNLIISGDSGTIVGATRGLSVYGNNIGLGGNIDADTTITINPSRTLTFKDTGTTISLNITPAGIYTLGEDGFGDSSIDIQPSTFTSNYNTTDNNCSTIINQTNQSVSLCSYNLISGNNANLQVCNNGRILAQGNAAFKGIEYGADYSANFVARSLVDAQYVTGLTSGLEGQIATKLNIGTFNTYTGATETRLSGIESDITYLSGQTDTKLAISDFNSYTGATETRISDLEDDVTELFNESLVNITGATNGLTKVSSKVVELGGALTKDTTISGLTHDFTVNVDNITLQSVGAINLIDANGVGGVNIESDGGVIKLQGNNSSSVPVTKIEVSETTLLITDDRVTPRGIQYAANYNNTFQNRSLVDKEYVDSVATGLIPKANVKVATTANITLSNTQTIDGVPVIAGDRVLVKDQTSGQTNGIYVVAAGAWSRSTDFDGTPDGEVSDGNLIPVLSGNTYGNTLWVLVTQNPITIGTTPLEFTLFSSPLELQAGVGIGITGQTIAVDGASLDGNSILWSGNTFNVDISTGTLATALSNIDNDIAYISGQTDTKLAISTFNTYTGATDTRLEGIEDDIVYLSGQTDTKLDISDFNSYTGATDTRLEGIEDDIVYISGVTDNNFELFTGFTASTVTNEIQLVHTGGTDINTVAATGIAWNSVTHSGNSFTWTGGTEIKINKTANYEVSYHIPHGHTGTNNVRGIGSNLLLNGATILNNTAGASATSRSGMIGNLVLPNTILSLSANDVLELIAFRTGLAGTSNTVVNGVILIKEKNKLQ